ncbi:MAG TPA: tetratricopeptide repeat protein [Flavobacteriales bacterium]
MSEENRDQHYAQDLVARYEQMLEANESYYFDIDQFEEIVDYYCFSSKLKKALEVIDYAYSLFPDNTTLMLKEAQILSGMGHLNKAMQRLRVLEQIEQNEDVLLTMASIYSQQREHRKAIALLQKAMALGGKEFEDEIYMEIALEYQNMERFDKAQEVLMEALSKRPENEVLLYELAYCFDVTDRTAESIEFYESFLDKYPYSFPAWYNLGNAYQKVGMLDKALNAYDLCLAIQEDFTPAYYNKAHTLFKMDRFQEAISVFEETYNYEAPQAPVYCHIGECFEKMNQLDKALFYYRKSIQTDELYADAYLGIGVALDLKNETAEGLTYVRRAIELDPENVDYLLFEVEFLKKLELWSEAESITEILIKRFADNEDAWMEHADIFFQRGETHRALEFINQGWQHCPQSYEIAYRKVVYLFETGKNNEAEELLLRLHESYPEGMADMEEYYPEIKRNVLYAELFLRHRSQ